MREKHLMLFLQPFEAGSFILLACSRAAHRSQFISKHTHTAEKQMCRPFIFIVAL
jgi:hypothetical protein